MRTIPFILFAALTFPTLALAQQSLDNDAVSKMVHAGLSDDIIISMIASQPGAYQVSPESLIALKSSGISERVLGAIVAKASGAPVATHAGQDHVAVSAVTSSEYDSLDTGVYQKVNGAWVSLQSERVNWKTGGVLKTIATDGIVKGDINGRITGATSPTSLHTPLGLIIRTSDGVEATDFELVHLHGKNNAREFRTLTGGVFHASGGTSRDAVGFQQKAVAHHTYLLVFATVPVAGEYAFLAPGFAASTTSGSTGKAYTFQLSE